MGGSCVAIIAKCVKVTTRSELVIDSVRSYVPHRPTAL